MLPLGCDSTLPLRPNLRVKCRAKILQTFSLFIPFFYGPRPALAWLRCLTRSGHKATKEARKNVKLSSKNQSVTKKKFYVPGNKFYFYANDCVGCFMRTPKTTIHDIARELHVTPSTVSRALNNHHSISDATKKAVATTARKLHYQHNKIASSLRLGRTRIIGVMIPSAEINFFGSVVHGIEKVAREKDYSILIFQSNEQTDFEREGVETFIRSRVDGVLVSISKQTADPSHFLELKKRRVPLVLFDRASDSLGVPSVVVDDYAGAFKATKHLLEQGCRCIAHIGGPQHVPIFHQRLQGYRNALLEAGLPVQDGHLQYGSISIESGKACMENLLRSAQPPDGIFAVEDFTALGAMQALKEKGLRIPGDVAIIGFANEAFGAFITPSLSTVDQQTIQMGEAAARLFFDSLEANDFYTAPPQKKVLEPVLVYRHSSLRHSGLVAANTIEKTGKSCKKY